MLPLYLKWPPQKQTRLIVQRPRGDSVNWRMTNQECVLHFMSRPEVPRHVPCLNSLYNSPYVLAIFRQSVTSYFINALGSYNFITRNTLKCIEHNQRKTIFLQCSQLVYYKLQFDHSHIHTFLPNKKHCQSLLHSSVLHDQLCDGSRQTHPMLK